MGRDDVPVGLEPAEALLEALKGEGPAAGHREDLAVQDVAPVAGRERGHHLGELAREIAPIPRVEPHVRVDLVELAPDAVVLVLDPERRAEAPDRVRRVRGRLGEHGVDGREVREPRGLEAAAARVERHRPQIGPVAVRGAHGLGRLTGRVGHRVFQRLLLHPDPRLAQHRLDERADRGRVSSGEAPPRGAPTSPGRRGPRGAPRSSPRRRSSGEARGRRA